MAKVGQDRYHDRRAQSPLKSPHSMFSDTFGSKILFSQQNFTFEAQIHKNIKTDTEAMRPRIKALLQAPVFMEAEKGQNELQVTVSDRQQQEWDTDFWCRSRGLPMASLPPRRDRCEWRWRKVGSAWDGDVMASGLTEMLQRQGGML